MTKAFLLLILLALNADARICPGVVGSYAASAGTSCVATAQSCVTTDSQVDSTLGATYRWKASKFVASADKTICGIRIKVGKVGSPTFDVNISIYASTGTEPDESSIIGTTEDVNASTFVGSGTKDWVTFPGIDADITNTTEYWLVVETSALGDASNYMVIDIDTGCDYEEGVLYSSNGTGWTSSSSTRGFRYILYE